MMKLNALVLFVLCGIAVNYALTLPPLPTCPDSLIGLLEKCEISGSLDLTKLLSSCPSTSSGCLATTVLGELGIDSNSTSYNNQDYITALVDAGLLQSDVQQCVAKVQALVDLLNINTTTCKLDLIGAVNLCIYENPLIGCTS